MGLDALGGYVFARMAHNMGESLIMVLFLIPLALIILLSSTGHDICPYNVAAAAGAVYGAITGFFHTIIGCVAGLKRTHSTNGHYTTTNVFGTVSGYDPNWDRGSMW